MNCEIVARCDTGRVRLSNEDAIGFDTEVGMAVLADGMGGHAAGEVASRIAVERVCEELVPALRQLDAWPAGERYEGLHQAMQRAAQCANEAILAAARRCPDWRGMGSTLVIAVFLEGTMTIGHLGDSRAYFCSGGEITRLTADHTWLDEQIALGVLAPDASVGSHFHNLLTRALGIEDKIELEIHDHDAAGGGIFLLCSDGLTDMLDDQCLCARTAAQATLIEVASGLVDAANEAGGRDNVSVVLMRVGQFDIGRQGN